MKQSSWVKTLEKWRSDFILALGGTAVDLNALIGAMIPFILVSSALHVVVFVDIIPNDLARLIASVVSALVIETYAIAVMVLDQRVATYNNSLIPGEFRIRYNARTAKLSYIILILATATITHIIPTFWTVPANFAVLAVIPMLIITWFGYEAFSVNFTLREALERREQLALSNSSIELARKQETLAIQNSAREQMALQVELEKAKATTAAAKADEAAAMAQAEEAKVKIERAKTRRVKAAAPARRVAEVTPANFDWTEASFDTIDQALKQGMAPPDPGEATQSRYQKMLSEFGTDGFSKTDLATIGDVSPSMAIKDLRVLYANRMVERAGSKYIPVNGRGEVNER